MHDSADITSKIRRAELPPPLPMPHFENTLPGLGERRELRRERFRAEVRVLPLDGWLPSCWASTEDISRRGMFMSIPVQYPLGTVLRLRLYTDHGELALTGKVVHRLDGVGVGCEFVDVEESQRVALAFLTTLRNPCH